MATYPKKLKPPRTYPANVVHAIRAVVNQTPNPVLGEIALVNGKAVHVGTIPANSFIMPAASQVKTAFAPTATIDVGTQAVPAALIPSASIVPGTAGNVVGGLIGAGMGKVTAETPVYILMGTAQATAGAVDIVIPFYVQGD